jgi:large subunit ribosomal protein L25
MEMITLQAKTRDPKAKVKVLRRGNLVPGIVYGHKTKDLLVQCDEKALRKAFTQAGESSLVELDVDGKKIPVLFKDVSFHPVSDREIHADFYAVNMEKKIDTMVPVRFQGESLAVKALGGVFLVVHDHIRVRALPKNLPHDLPVSIAGMENFHDHVTVSQITVPEGVEILEKPEAVLAVIQEPRTEEVVATPVAAAAVPGAEGAAAAPGAEGAAPAAAGAPGAAPAAEAGKDAKKEAKK